MKNKFNIATIISCSLVIVVLAVMFFVTPDNAMSQKENRTLTQLPSFSMDRLFSGEYTGELATYINDQFPERDAFVSAKAYSELALGKRENNGIIYAENDILIARDIINDNRLNENLQAIKEFEKVFAEAFNSGKPAIIDARVDIDEMVLPMVPGGKPVYAQIMELSKEMMD